MAGAVVGMVVSSFVAEVVAAEVVIAGLALDSVFLIEGATMIGAGVGALAGGVASSTVNGALAGDPATVNPQPSAVSSARAQGMLINAASNIEPVPVLYGSRRMGGGFALEEVSGGNNEYFHLVVSICEGEIDGFDQVYLDDVPYTDARFAGLVSLETYVGTDTQAASAALVAALPGVWSATDTGSGTAYLYLRLTYSQDAYHGRPVITADVRGRKLYDPRTGLTVWSDNPALAIRDYLTNARYGWGVAGSAIDDAAIIVAANHCDDLVAVPGGTQKRYTIDGAVDVNATLLDNLKLLLTSCRGMLRFGAGQYKLIIDKAETPSAVIAFTEDNITGEWAISKPGRRATFNRVTASFFNRGAQWQPDFAPWDSTAYRTQDGELLLEYKINLPFTSNMYRAMQLAGLHGKQSRFGITARFSAFQEGLRCEVGDVVPITHSTPGWVDKPFRVMQIDIKSDDEVDVVVREYDASAYALDTLAVVTGGPATNLPDPLSVAALGVPIVVESKYETTGSAGVKARATMSWAAAADAFVVDYLPEYRVAGGTWIVRPSTRAITHDIDDIAPGTYEFRVRARNALGAHSAYSGTRTKEIVGLTDAPADVSGFSVVAFAGAATGRWTLTPDLDVKIGGRIFVRWTPLTVGAAWENGIDVRDFNGDATSGPLPMLTGTYFAKARDSTGHWSAAAASFVLTAGNLTALPDSLTLTEHTAFAGTKTGVVAVDSVLKLEGGSLIDSLTDLIDDWGYIDNIGGVVPAGTYDFSTAMDFGSVVTRRITPTIQALAYDTGDRVDSRGPVDDWDSVDGDVINDVTAQLQAATSADGVSYGSWFPLLSGDVTCRAVKFRLALASAAPTHNIQISHLYVTANW